MWAQAEAARVAGTLLNGLIPFYYKGNSQGSLKIKGKETKDLDIFQLSKIIALCCRIQTDSSSG